MGDLGLRYLALDNALNEISNSPRSPLKSAHNINRVKKIPSHPLSDDSMDINAEKIVDAITKEVLTINNDQKIILNVGGTRFETRLDTITKHGTNTMLGAMLLSFNSEPKEEYFIDRDSELFRYILNYYRTGFLMCPSGIHVQVMQNEVDFYGIPKDAMRVYQKQFTLAAKKVYSCKSCGIHIADSRDAKSKNFTGKTGVAYFVENTVNVTEGEDIEKDLMSGKHVVAEITCNNCNSYIGWKYQKALTAANKYKEGKFVIEKASIVKEKNI